MIPQMRMFVDAAIIIRSIRMKMDWGSMGSKPNRVTADSVVIRGYEILV
jgi:hypothetical protein